MSERAIKFVEEWKDFKVGDVTTVNDVMAEELIGSGIAENASTENSNEGALSKGYHTARLLGLRNRKVFMQRQLDMIDKQIEFEEDYLEEGATPRKDIKVKRVASKE